MLRLISLTGCLVLAVSSAVADGPLHDEDIVRMVIQGVPDGTVIETIRASAVEFDLSDEMVEELRIAGVSDAVIRAMRDRQAELDGDSATGEPSGPQPGATDAEPSEPVLALRVVADGRGADDDSRATLSFPGAITTAAAESMQIGTSVEERTITGAAFYVACVTATHVPDHWRRKSNLGRDFISMPRHRMLEFIPEFEIVESAEIFKKIQKAMDGPHHEDSGEIPRGVELTLPESIDLDVETGTPHQLISGIALEIGGRYYNVSATEPREVVVGPQGAETWVEVTAGANSAFQPRIRFLQEPPAP